MYYLAKWRINHAGQIILPGTIFEADFSKEQEERLLKLGAVVYTDEPAPMYEDNIDIPQYQAETGAYGGDQSDADPPEGADAEPKEAPQNGAEGEEEATAEDERDEDEADEDAPVPIIDASEGIVEAPATQPEATPDKKKNTRRGKK